ncbi:MAG: SH3 domain-containing protein [Epsilonproteobacteria bacterium]|nr:SH3 domain-containing protein [Campylobacterota bacterium]
MRYILYVFIAVFLSACAQKPIPKIQETPSDLLEVNQSVTAYLDTINERNISSLEAFEKHYFNLWNIKKIDISKKEAMWAYRSFRVGNSYGENLQPLKQSFFDDIYARSNFAAYSSLNKPAITLKALNIRAFPTDKPLLMDPKKAGEGFPFDYMQNSLIAPNKPILVSHYSRDKEWVFIEASFAYGWVKARDIAFIPKAYAKLYQEAEKEFVIKESHPIYDAQGNFLFRSRIGMLLPEIKENNASYTVLSIGNYKNNEAFYIRSTIPKSVLHKGILEFNVKNIAMIFQEVSAVKYGWGGMYQQRDCSSILRDFFAPFGLWLPRNSYEQSKLGKVISLEGLSDTQKLQLIKEKAVPFETLLYKKGHILLFVGVKNGEPIVFHATWGIKTKKDEKEGRFIIGKPIFSTLELGSNLKDYDKNASILTQLKSMNILTQ